MAEGLNRVMLLGNLGADPELRMTQGGQAVLKFRVATTERYLDRNRARQEKTEWHSVVIWGRRAEALNTILSKGTRVFVEGSLRTTNYEDKEGHKRYRTEIVAHNLLLQGGGAPGRREEAPAAANDYQAAAPVQPSGAPQSGNYDDGAYGAVPEDDDIPF